MRRDRVRTPASDAPDRPSVSDNARWETWRALARLQPAERQELLTTTVQANDGLAERRPAFWLAARWLRRLSELLPPDGARAVASDLPAGNDGLHEQPMPHLDDWQFVLVAHEALLRRGCHRDELEHCVLALQERRISRKRLLWQLILERRRLEREDAARAKQGELAFYIMGSGERITEAAWRQRCSERLADRTPLRSEPDQLGPALPPGLRISAITSLYKGGRHIERYLSNMAAQSCFATHLELVIVDADSPDGEQGIIEAWARRYDNIRYVRLPQRVGIYEAWNIALRMSSGSLLTSANVDDLRRDDSIEQQARVLAQDDTIDVVYQDFFYTLDADLPFDDIARLGYRSQLPDTVSAAELMRCNPPHNAPMWRKRLHDELGLFDEAFQSAGDYDFWMRCALAGKRFAKTADAHVAYFHNPEGLSTRSDTRGHAETREVHRRYARWIHDLPGMRQTSRRTRRMEN